MRKQFKYQIEHEIAMNKEANYFARCLLIPEKFIRPDVMEMVKTTDIDTAVIKLSSKYKVPVTAMVLRLAELSLINI